MTKNLDKRRHLKCTTPQKSRVKQELHRLPLSMMVTVRSAGTTSLISTQELTGVGLEQKKVRRNSVKPLLKSSLSKNRVETNSSITRTSSSGRRQTGTRGPSKSGTPMSPSPTSPRRCTRHSCLKRSESQLPKTSGMKSNWMP